MGRIRVGIIFGGRSAEHEVSLQSARNIISALDREKYEPVLIGIDRSGRWYLSRDSDFLLGRGEAEPLQPGGSDSEVTLIPGEGSHRLLSVEERRRVGNLDVAFPVLHGPYGEDGTVQGLLKLAGIPFVGAGVLGSAVGMDKEVMKRLLREAGLPTVEYLICREGRWVAFSEVERRLGLPVFVKPANLGSSVGICRAENPTRYEAALREAFRYDRKVIVERAVEGRELECSVLGNEQPIASLPGEVLPRDEFYSYRAKYIDEDGAELEIPARLEPALVKRVQEMAVRTFEALCCEGMARVDFFLLRDESLLVNEINTIPGFTRISMYPKLWVESGISYPELIDRLIQLALERHERERRLKVDLDPD